MITLLENIEELHIVNVISNYKWKEKNAKIPVFFHNLQNYDVHHIMNGLAHYGRTLDDGSLEKQGEKNPNIEVLAKSLEKFFQIRLGNNLIIKDSLNFLP